MKKFFSILLLTAFATGTAVFSADKIIFFDKNTDAAARKAGVEKLGGELKRDLPEIFASVAIFPDTIGKASLTKSAMQKKVQTVVDEEDNKVVNWLHADQFDTSLKQVLKDPTKVSIVPIDTNLKVIETSGTKTNGQQIPWGIGRVESNAAWKRGYTGKGVVVGIIDTGIKLNHPDLKDNIIGSYNALNEELSADDGNGHGTHVAGTIAAIDNKIGVVGIAKEAKLLAVQVLDASGSGSFDAVAAGVIWAVNNGAQVLNMSLGSSWPAKAVEEAINYAVSKNVAVICASGNDGRQRVSYPAAYPAAIAVSASDINSKIAWFSNTGKEIAFIAPGVDVLSTYKNDYATLSGTSMACPHIAGLAALTVQAGASNRDEVLAALKFAARPLKDLNEIQQGNGFVKGRWIGER